MSTTFANSIDSNPIYADRAENDKDGNRIDQTYAKSASLATVATTGDYDDLSDKPDLSIYAETANLATVATTGSYDDLADKPTIPAAQVNSDWNASSGVAEILNKPTLSTVATTGDYDDLVNKPSIPAAQVNADWNSSSGVSEILNKPTLAAVATSGDYSDLSNKPSIPMATSDLTNDSNFITASDVPGAQVQSDWTESDSTDPSYIANKPTLAAVATSGDYGDLINTPTINNVPAVTSNDDNKVLKASYTGGVGSYSWEAESGGTVTDVEVDGTSVVSGGVASITMPTELVPTVTSSDDGKVLKAAYSGGTGSYSWETESGGGGTQADWAEDDPLEPSYIENKPVPKTLTAGANISISEGVGTLTISAAAGLPASTSADEGKCLVVDSNGDPEWGTGGKTYTGVDGVTVDNVNDTVGLEAPVDIVAGPGIAIDNPDGNTLRITNIGFPISETDAVRCGTFKGDPMYMKTYTFTGTVGTSETTINMTIDEKKGTDNVNRIWIDPSTSFILYGSAGNNFLPLSWRLGSGRQGSVAVLGATTGSLSCRCIDTSSTPITLNITIRYTVSNP